jgi:hypothetical protein
MASTFAWWIDVLDEAAEDDDGEGEGEDEEGEDR